MITGIVIPFLELRHKCHRVIKDGVYSKKSLVKGSDYPSFLTFTLWNPIKPFH